MLGFGDRLLNEVKKLAVKDVKIKIYAPPERKYSTWIGGSILAGLNTFKKVSVTRPSVLMLANIQPDVGIRRGVPGRSRYYPQKGWVLGQNDFLFLTLADDIVTVLQRYPLICTAWLALIALKYT
jgi:hypothetical protein